MRVVVTGGAGFIGSHVVEALVARGDEVHVVDDLSRGRRENVPGCRDAPRRATSASRSTRSFGEIRPEAIVHLAAQIDVRVSVADPVADAAPTSSARSTCSRRRGRTARRSSSPRPAARSTASATGPPREDVRPAAALAVRDVEARGRGVPRARGTASTAPATSRCGSATSTGRARIRTARPASSRSSSSACATACPRRSTATGSRPATTSTSATSPRAALAALDGETAACSTSAPGSETSVVELWEACCATVGTPLAGRSGRGAPGRDPAQRARRVALAAERLGWRPATTAPDGLAATWEWLRKE